MRLAYIAGPYRAATEYEVHRNIQRAEEAAALAWQKGYAVICPHKNSAYMGGVVDDAAILAGDLEMLRRCDVMILVGEWNKSAGTCGELAEAIRLGMAVYEYRELHGVRGLWVMEPPDLTRKMAKHHYGERPGSQVSDAAYDDGAAFGGAVGATAGNRHQAVDVTA